MKIVYTLSGGAAFGYAHVGVLKYLEELDLRPEAVVGTSMGAIVGGLYAFGYEAKQIQQIADQVKSIELVRLFFPSFPRGGIIDTDGIRDFFHGFVGDIHIEDLEIEYRCVAVDVDTGQEVVFDRGRLIDGMIASMSIPAIFKPYQYQGRYLVDGGVLNNLPWDVGQELGDTNIVVDVAPQLQPAEPRRLMTSDFVGEAESRNHGARQDEEDEDFAGKVRRMVQIFQKQRQETFSFSKFVGSLGKSKEEDHSLTEMVTKVMAIVDGATGPDIDRKKVSAYLHPDLLEYELNDFHKAEEIIEIGYTSARKDRSFSTAVKKIAKKREKKKN
ncbi:MAG TPA: hypothetical protein ENN41_09695 [Sediminispirochaeta sp.]|nr:hypothetical protein [Sediminispirochaeta sp.]